MFRPIREIGLGSRDPHIRSEFLKNISQARLWLRSRRNRERESHSRSGSVIRVLAENHDLHFIERSHIERSKNIFPSREATPRSVFRLHECREFMPIRLLEFTRECGEPRWMDAYRRIHEYEYIKTPRKIEGKMGITRFL